MKILTYHQAMDQLVKKYERYKLVEEIIISQKDDPEVVAPLKVEKELLLNEIKDLSGEPLTTIEEMVTNHKASRK